MGMQLKEEAGNMSKDIRDAERVVAEEFDPEGVLRDVSWDGDGEIDLEDVQSRLLETSNAVDTSAGAAAIDEKKTTERSRDADCKTDSAIRDPEGQAARISFFQQVTAFTVPSGLERWNYTIRIFV